MIENKFRSKQQLEDKRNKEEKIRWIASMDDVKSVTPLDPDGKDQLPKKCYGIFEQIAERSVRFDGESVTVDVNSFDCFFRRLEPGPLWTDH